MHAYVCGRRSVHGVCVACTPVCDVCAPTCAWWVCTGVRGWYVHTWWVCTSVSVWYVCESIRVA